ncbi:MAG: glycosyltransferase [Chromatiales bacterium]
MPTVSVITTFHNAAETLSESINSVMSQQFADFEYLLVDDGSDDSSAELVRGYDDNRIRLLQPGRVGRAAALNLALQHACGDYIAILDADDICLQDRLSLQASMLANNGALTLVCSNVELVDQRGRKTGMTRFPVAHEALFKSLTELNPFPHSSVMFRREAAIQIGGYNLRCEKSIDFNFYLDLLAAGGKFLGYGQALIRLRSYPGSWGKNDKQALQMRYGILGLVNYYQRQRGDGGILHVDEAQWNVVKQNFDHWFDHQGYQQRLQAKQIFSGIRQQFRQFRFFQAARQLPQLFRLDPWFWRYRGCGFVYPQDVTNFLHQLDVLTVSGERF